MCATGPGAALRVIRSLPAPPILECYATDVERRLGRRRLTGFAA